MPLLLTQALATSVSVNLLVSVSICLC